MIQPKAIQGVIFDLDGTLIDSWLDIAYSVNYTLAQLSFPERNVEEIKSFIGDGVYQLMECALGQSQLRHIDNSLILYKSHYREHCLDHTDLYPNVREVLEALFIKYPLFIVTNKPENFSKQILKRLDIDQYFQAVIGEDSCKRKKPYPDGILHLSEQYKIPTHRMVMIGDHHIDITTGKNAKCATIFCEYGFGTLKETPPDHTIQSVTELIPLLEA